MRIHYNNETLYKAFVSIIVLMYMLESTALTDFNDSIVHDSLQILALMIAFIYIVRRKYSLKELGMLFILNSIGLFCFISSGLTGLFMTMLAITLLPAESLDRVLNMIFKEEFTIFIIIVTLSFCGILDNQIVDINKGLYIANAYSLGFNHPNMLAAQGTSIVLLYLCVNRNKLKNRHYIISMFSIVAIYFFARGRTSLMLGIMAIFIIMIRNQKMVTNIILKILPWMYIIVFIVLIACMAAYAKLGENTTMVRIINDSLFNGRIGLAYRSLLVYPITAFGKVIDTSIWNEYQYYALDNGQVMVLLEYGIMGFLAYFWVIQRTLKKIKMEKEVVFGIVIIVFLVWSMFEGTMYFIGKNFALLFLGTSNYMLNPKWDKRRKYDS